MKFVLGFNHAVFLKMHNLFPMDRVHSSMYYNVVLGTIKFHTLLYWHNISPQLSSVTVFEKISGIMYSVCLAN